MSMVRTFWIAGFTGVVGLLMSNSVWAENQVEGATRPENVPESVTYTTIGPSPWFRHPPIRQELQLDDEQYQRLNNNYDLAWKRYKEQVRKLGDKRDLTPAQRMALEERLYSDFHNSILDNNQDVFNDTASLERFHQLNRQYQTYGAFYDPVIQQRLGLTPAQRQQLRDADRGWNRQMTAWHRSYKTDPDVVIKKFNAARGDYDEDLKRILTPEQQKTWSVTIGEPYTFDPNIYFQPHVDVATPVVKPLPR